MAQIVLVVGHHADEGNIDGRSAEEHRMVGYRNANGLTWCGGFVSALGGRVWEKKGGKYLKWWEAMWIKLSYSGRDLSQRRRTTSSA